MKIKNMKFLIAGATMILTQMSIGANLAHADEYNQQTPEQKIQSEENAKKAKELLGSFFNKGKELATTAAAGVQSGIHNTAKFVQEKTEPTINNSEIESKNKSKTKMEISESVKSLVTPQNTAELEKNFSIFKSNVSNIIGNIRAKATEPNNINNNTP